MSEWRHPEERAELVERLIRAEKRAAAAERTLRDVLGEERGVVQALRARIEELEGIVARLNRKVMGRKGNAA